MTSAHQWFLHGRRFAVGSLFCLGVLQASAQQPAAPVLAEPIFKMVVDASSVTTYHQNQPVLRYRYGEVPFKPYVDRLYTPGGINVLRDAPVDHKHHHGLMFATSVDGVDFWAELAANGRQLHQSLNEVRVGRGVDDVQYAGFMDDLAWVDPSGKNLLLAESRRVELIQLRNQQSTLLTWESFLEPPEGKKSVTLSGSEYFGLGMRFVQTMDTGGRFFNADGKTDVAGTNAVRSRWCAYTASAGGKPVTVAVFDHPANVRHPATWFTMTQGFAYLAVTIDLSKQPLVLQQDQPLLLRYGVALWDGAADPKEVDALYRRWADLFRAPPQQPLPAGEPAPSPAVPPRPTAPQR